MRAKLFIFLLLLVASVHSQEAVHNYGAIQIHNTAMVGFHMDLINNGNFDENEGLVGFYGVDRSITISGAFSPIFFNTEIAVDNGLYLDTPIGVTNNGSLIFGDIITPRTHTSAYTNFIDEAFYVGENNLSLIDGYAAITNKNRFTFPVGDDGMLRPLGIRSEVMNPIVKCAYFFGDPNAPSPLGKSFKTSKKSSKYLSVSEIEYWHLEGNLPVKATLTWNEQSNIGAIATYISDLKVVGWSKESGTWENLGNTDVEGAMLRGSVTSDEFIPNDYEVITLGGNDDKMETFKTIELDNYFMTPNGDGKNDQLVLDGIQSSPNNDIQIFNRYGVMVYSKTNYQNEFNGISNRKTAISKGSGLASGIYFYIITLHDLKQKHQGYLYISTSK